MTDGSEAISGNSDLATMSMEYAAIGMAITGPDGRFRLVNPALCRMLSYDREQLEGMSFAEITHPDDAAAGVQAVADMIAGRTHGFAQRKRYLASDGHVVWIDLSVTPVRDGHGDVTHFVAQMVDVSAEVAARDALAESLEQYRVLAENASDVVLGTGPDGTIRWVSPSVTDELGYSPDALVGDSIMSLVDSGEGPGGAATFGDLAGSVTPTSFRTATGGRVVMSVLVKPVEDVTGKTVGAVVGLRDVTQEVRERDRLERLVEGIRDLHDSMWAKREVEVLTFAIDLIVELTDSEIGYLHSVNDDQETVELGTWSTSTIGYCSVTHDRHYSIEQAGIWADTFRTRSAHVHNDYAAVPDKRGLPEGHSELRRHLGVPVVADGGVRLLLGVGNKATEYDSSDVSVAQLIGDELWRILERMRRYRRDEQRLELLSEAQTGAGVGTFEWDLEEPELALGRVARELLGRDPGEHFTDWQVLFDRLDADSRQALARALDPSAGDPNLEVRGLTDDGEPLCLWLAGRWVGRPSGNGSVLMGTIVDISLADEAEAARFRAVHDPLTGLLNREGLLQDITSRLAARGQRATDEFAVHFVDLDHFKEVNDRFGHLIGDEVLRVCAGRLAAAVRSDDIVARLGGDEFVVVQANGPDRQAMVQLARELIAAVRPPIRIEHERVVIGASVGVAPSLWSLPDARALLHAADRAMYRAKQAATGVEFANIE